MSDPHFDSRKNDILEVGVDVVVVVLVTDFFG
jgi:peroxiredoxin